VQPVSWTFVWTLRSTFGAVEDVDDDDDVDDDVDVEDGVVNVVIVAGVVVVIVNDDVVVAVAVLDVVQLLQNTGQ